MVEQIDKETEEYYLDRREVLSKIRSSSTESYDKTILQLSTGALAITVAFLEKIGKPYSDITNLLISASWIGYLLVIILNLLSFYFARKNMDFKIKDLDDRYKNYESDTGWPPEQFSCYRKVTEFCNTATLWLFFVSTALLVVYAVMVQNYSYQQASQNKSTQEVTMSQEKKSGKIVHTEDRSGEFNEAAKKAQKEIVRKAETETSEPIIRPTEKPKK